MTTNCRFHGWTSVALLAVAGLMALVFWGPGPAVAVSPRAPGDRAVLRVAYTQKLLPDPHRRNFPLPQYNQFMLCLWEPLVECDPATGQPRPAAAESWTWSEDRRTLTLHLRPDAHWSNGDPVTARDFVRGWLRLLRHGAGEALTLFPLRNAEAFQRGKIAATAVGLQAIDDLTLRLQLDQPRSTWLAELADPLLSPLHRTSEAVLADQEYFARPDSLVTNGPFRLLAADADGFRLAACPYFHDASGVRLAGIHFIRADRPALAPLMVAVGVADLFVPTPYGASMAVPTERPVGMETELELTVSSLDFNVTRGPLGDARVRRALAFALHREEPIRQYDPGHMVAAWSWVPSLPGRKGLELLKEDVGEARRLLAAAGYPGGRGLPVLRMALPLWMKSDPFPSAWTEQWFRELGVKTYICYENPAQREERMRSGDYDVLCNAMTATVPDAGDLLGIFAWPMEYSGTKWLDQKVVSQLREAELQTGEMHLAALDEVERRVMAALPAVPVMFEHRQTLVAAEVKGWYPDPLGRQALKRYWLDLPVVPSQPASPTL